MMRDVSVTREVALIDAYAGLRRIGYTKLGAIRALRTLGASFGEAKQASDTVEAIPSPQPLQLIAS